MSEGKKRYNDAEKFPISITLFSNPSKIKLV